MRFRVEYQRPRELVTDHDEQLVRGGLLVRVTPPAGLQLFSTVELELVPPGGAVVRIQGQVVQMVAGIGVAVAFAPAAIGALAAAVSAARAAAEVPGGAALHRIVGVAPPAPAASSSTVTSGSVSDRAAAAAPGSAHASAQAPAAAAVPGCVRAAPPHAADDAPARVQNATTAAKISLALHGTRDERAAILRDLNRTLHPYVLKNPNLQLDEVVAMARMTAVSPELLRGIAERREWATRAEIAIALVRNPKTPVSDALRLLEHVAPADLRQLAKDNRARPQIQQAARRKVLG